MLIQPLLDLSTIKEFHRNEIGRSIGPVLTTHDNGFVYCDNILSNPNTDYYGFYFISLNFHEDRLIENRGKKKVFFGCTQQQQYNYFKERILKGKEYFETADVSFAYTFFEKNYAGKVHMHQLVYLPNKNIWDYKAMLYSMFNFTKKEINSKSLHCENIVGLDGVFEYIFNKKEKFYELLNQNEFKPIVYFFMLKLSGKNFFI